MRTLPLWLLIALSACQSSAPADDVVPADPFAGRLIDLTHAFDAETIYWPTEDGFQLATGFEGRTEGGYFYEANSFTTAEHGGTHLDAPVHFSEGQHAVEQIPLNRLIGPGAVIDVSTQAAADADYQITVADLEAWEAEHAPLADGTLVLFRTDFAQHWPDRVRYMGTEARGDAAVAALHFPGLHPDAARWLVANRNVAAVGLDTPSIDFGQSTLFEAHRVLFAENIPAFENVAAMDALPPMGFTVIALPMKIASGSGAPLRIVAIVPQ